MALKKQLFGMIVAVGCAVLPANAADTAPTFEAVVNNYADIALAGYEDSLTLAVSLQSSIDKLLDRPSEETLAAARKAWIDARVPYMQTETYRFGNPVVDEWEGRVNAWPLDEGLIDYVDEGYGTESEENELYTANVIANQSFKLGGKTVDATAITKSLLIDVLHEGGGVEGNVATGYHAIEFLLWGQDLNGTGPGAGGRPASDFDQSACTNGHCARRAQYLRVVAEMLIDDLTWMTGQWKAGGAARNYLLDDKGKVGINAIFAGMGSLTYGELAGERMKLGLLLHDPEEEHDCFSDNTHNSHYYDVLGIQNVYLGRYKRVDGSDVSGPSVSDLVKTANAGTDAELRRALETSLAKFAALKKRAETQEAYDQMIGEGNEEGNKVVADAIDALLTQTRELERAIAALKLQPIEFEGSDSLDKPGQVGAGAQ